MQSHMSCYRATVLFFLSRFRSIKREQNKAPTALVSFLAPHGSSRRALTQQPTPTSFAVRLAMPRAS
eukprot:scaffold4736_cov118-Isochrysis_galbana.AAC.5